MKLNKIFLAAAFAALTLALFAGCGSTDSTDSSTSSEDTTSEESTAQSDSGELQQLRVALMTGQVDQYAAYVGEEQGIFESYGIEISSAEYAAGINTMDAVQNGTADTGLLADFAAVNRIGNTLEDTNLVIFAELSSSESSNGGLYVAPQYADDLQSLQDSEGIIQNTGTVSEYYNWQAITFIGLDPDTFNYVITSDQSTSLALAQNGDASAVVATGAQAQYYENYDWVLVASAKDIGIKVGTYLLTTNEFLAENTELIANYLKALGESVDYINEHFDESANEFESVFGISPDDFKETWDSYTISLGFTEEGAQQLDDVNAWALENGKYEQAYDIRDFIDTSAAEIAFPDRVTIEQ